MAHKTFISYKYSDASDLRDRIIAALGKDATYYQGETSKSPDLTDCVTETIKDRLADMIFDTTVTIVVLSPHMTESLWIPWEIGYSIKNITREGRTSHTNGLVGVIKKVNGSYNWFKGRSRNCHGDSTVVYYMGQVPDIVSECHYNSNPPQRHCSKCKTYDWLNGSYIAFVEEDAFLNDPQRYIDNAYEKSENDAEGYDLPRTR